MAVLDAPRADLRELGMRADREAEALIVGQVPVKDVEAIEREQIDVALDELLREEVARHVEVHGAHAMSRCVVDVDARQLPSASGSGGGPHRDACPASCASVCAA